MCSPTKSPNVIHYQMQVNCFENVEHLFNMMHVILAFGFRSHFFLPISAASHNTRMLKFLFQQSCEVPCRYKMKNSYQADVKCIHPRFQLTCTFHCNSVSRLPPILTVMMQITTPANNQQNMSGLSCDIVKRLDGMRRPL